MWVRSSTPIRQRVPLDLNALPGGVLVPTFWASKMDHEPFYATLERRLLTPVVHARLAKIVVGLGAFQVFLYRKHVDAFGELGQLIALPLCRPLGKFRDLLFKLTYAIFRRIFRINARLCFLIELQAGHLDVNKYPCQALLGFGDLVMVSGHDGGFREFNGALQAGKGGNGVHKSSPGVEMGGVATPDSTFGGNTAGEMNV